MVNHDEVALKLRYINLVDVPPESAKKLYNDLACSFCRRIFHTKFGRDRHLENHHAEEIESQECLDPDFKIETKKNKRVKIQKRATDGMCQERSPFDRHQCRKCPETPVNHSDIQSEAKEDRAFGPTCAVTSPRLGKDDKCMANIQYQTSKSRCNRPLSGSVEENEDKSCEPRMIKRLSSRKRQRTYSEKKDSENFRLAKVDTGKSEDKSRCSNTKSMKSSSEEKKLQFASRDGYDSSNDFESPPPKRKSKNEKRTGKKRQ